MCQKTGNNTMQLQFIKLLLKKKFIKRYEKDSIAAHIALIKTFSCDKALQRQTQIFDNCVGDDVIINLRQMSNNGASSV